MPAEKKESTHRLLLCINAILQKKEKDIAVLNIKENSSFADYMIICSGATERQNQALCGAIQQYLKKEGILPLGVEGEAYGQWILLDHLSGDGIAMGHYGMKYSLASRELIADCVESMMEAHQFDAMICIPNCDKIVPGMLMAAARLNLPTIFISDGGLHEEQSCFFDSDREDGVSRLSG